MLTEEQSITFVSGLLELIESYLATYEGHNGPLRNDLERGLVIAYLLGVMHCDLESIWECVGKARVFGALHPRIAFEECVGSEAPSAVDRQAAITEEFRKRGWLSI